MNDNPDNMSANKPPIETPFPRRWIFYIILKFIVIAAAVLITLSVYGLI